MKQQIFSLFRLHLRTIYIFESFFLNVESPWCSSSALTTTKLSNINWFRIAEEKQRNLTDFIFPQSVLFHLKCIYRNDFLASLIKVGKYNTIVQFINTSNTIYDFRFRWRSNETYRFLDEENSNYNSMMTYLSIQSKATEFRGSNFSLDIVIKNVKKGIIAIHFSTFSNSIP